MSGVCAIVNFDGAPVEPGMLKKMTAASKYRGPDGEAYWVEGNFGVAHQASHITPEEIYENQPSVSPHGDLVLAADARLDNRNELIRLLRAKNQVRSDLPTDVELILAAYMVWGEACPKYLVGDFAFIVWDKKQKKVFVARDPIGVRQIHYYQNGKTLAIATTVAAILAIRRDVPVMNMPLLHDTLRGNFDRWINETAYKSIYRLPPSYSLTAESGSISLNRYWVLGENNIVNYKDEREYADHYKELLFQAVQAQLRSNGKIAVMGGAGVDSGSVACCSNKLIELNGTSSLIYAYLGVFNNIPDAEEREYLRITTDYCKHIVPRLINCDDCWALREFPEDLGYPHDDVDISNVDRAMLLRLTRAAQQDGCRVMLTGYWGDQVNGQAAYRIPKFIRDIPFKRLFKELPHFLSNPNLPRWQILARGFGGPNLPTKMSNRLASFIYRLPPDLVRTADDPNYDPMLPPPNHLSGAGTHISFSVSSGLVSARLASYDRVSAYSGIELRNPYLDRRLVDFMLNIPGRYLFRDGTSRHLQRQALKGTLPESIRNRTSKANFTKLYEIGFREKETKKIHTLISESHIVATGLIDEQKLKNAWTNYWNHEFSDTRMMLWMLCIEIWMRRHAEYVTIK